MLDPRTHEPTNPFLLYNGNGTTTTHRSYNSSWDEEVDSPPLWSTSPSRDHNRANHHHHYRSMSPASRTQAIVRGQRELMEMVKNMPESNYELSLKDLVEHHHRHNNNSEEAPTAAEDQRKTKSLKNGSGRGGGGSRRVVRRSGSIDRGSGGFYLKMVIPSFSLGSKKKNKNKNKNNESLASANNSKVSPRPTTNNNNNSDKEWWKKSDDSGSSSLNSGSSTKRSGSSSSSNSSSSTSNSRVRNEKSNGHRCWPCIPRRKRQTQK
ncbi:hypothetical protein HN51_052533 [Arachis hypogaea]|uniref:uncharacterized protein n=1 Tax=Arachis hypogaea TaxID=3818 RepID=UPI0007AF5341|nr:probable serine/threonine-protein kinase dyrk1 [Arachis ipaensis]XP_025666518.1 probable serine/threonine-protein kinase dyrk1 [Arachis hypogaea]QHN93882.1 uncharacterized protein DS421_17g596470 [Arachis hypogaea]